MRKAFYSLASTGLWAGASAAALALHIGAAGAAFYVFAPLPEEEAAGAPAIEISLEAAAPPRTEEPDLPPGPMTEESAATPPAAAQQEAKAADTPKVTDTQSEEADFTHVVEKKEKTREIEEKKETKSVASTPSTASEAMAPPKSEAPVIAPQPAAPTQGADAAASRVKASWQRALIAHLNRNKRYPANAARKTASASVSFKLDRLGHVETVAIVKSSGDPLFDEAAIAMLRRADPAPAPPPAMADENLTFEIPVNFRAPTN